MISENHTETDDALLASAQRVLETAQSLDPRTTGILIIRILRDEDDTASGIAFSPAGRIPSPAVLTALIEIACADGST